MKLVDLQSLSESEISERQLPLEHLWWAKAANGEPYGPFETPVLKEFVLAHPAEAAGMQLACLADDAWIQVTEWAPLKARTPQLVSAATLKVPERHFVLSMGQKHGPFTAADLQAQLAATTLLASDQVSVDEGATWQKVFELKHLELTRHSADALPGAPVSRIIDRPIEAKGANLLTEGLASLAYVGRRDSTPIQFKEWDVKAIEVVPEKAIKRPWKALSAIASVACVAVVAWQLAKPAPDINDVELAEVGDELEVVSPGTSLLDPVHPRPRVMPRRRPASVASPQVPSPMAMRDPVPEIMRYEDTHDAHQEPPEPPETTDEQPYEEGPQLAHTEEDTAPQRDPASEAAAAPAEDGYSLESPGAEAPVVEEVGDF
jgi:hypothetical protein